MEKLNKQVDVNNQNESSDNSDKSKLFSSPELFGDSNEIKIDHEGEIYRIRITRNGKLIMNK